MAEVSQSGSSPLARNTFLNLVGQGLPLVVAACAIPFIIRGLGQERFGILSLIWVLLGYFGVFDFGLSRAATKYLAEAFGRGDRDAAPSVFWTAVTSQGALGVLGGLTLVLAAGWLVRDALNVPQALVAETHVSFLLMALALPAILVSGSCRGLLEAEQRFDLVNAIRVPASIGFYLSPLLAIDLGFKLPGTVGLLVLLRYLTLIAFGAIAIRRLPGRLRSSYHFGRDRVRELFGFGAWVTVSDLLGPILVYMDRFALGALVTVSAVGYYAAPYELITRLTIVATSLAAALFPAFTAMGATHREDRVSLLLWRSTKFVLLSVGPIAAFAIAFAPEILRLWLGEYFAVESKVALQVLAAGVLLNSLAQVPAVLLQGRGRPDLPAKFHMVELLMHVLVVWYAVTTWGVSGAALAWSIRVLVDAALLYVSAGRSLPSPFHGMHSVRLPETLGTVVCLVAAGVVPRMLGLGLGARCVTFGVSCAAGVWYGYHYLVTADEKVKIATGLLLKH